MVPARPRRSLSDHIVVCKASIPRAYTPTQCPLVLSDGHGDGFSGREGQAPLPVLTEAGAYEIRYMKYSRGLSTFTVQVGAAFLTCLEFRVKGLGFSRGLSTFHGPGGRCIPHSFPPKKMTVTERWCSLTSSTPWPSTGLVRPSDHSQPLLAVVALLSIHPAADKLPMVQPLPDPLATRRSCMSSPCTLRATTPRASPSTTPCQRESAHFASANPSRSTGRSPPTSPKTLASLQWLGSSPHRRDSRTPRATPRVGARATRRAYTAITVCAPRRGRAGPSVPST